MQKIPAMTMPIHPDPGGPAPLPGDPSPGQSPYPEEVPPVDPIGVPKTGPDTIDPAVPTPGLPGGVPGGPPAIPGMGRVGGSR